MSVSYLKNHQVQNKTQNQEQSNTFRMGRITAIDQENETVLVDYPDNPYPIPIAAQIGCTHLTFQDLLDSVKFQDQIRIEFEFGNPASPIIRDVYRSLKRLQEIQQLNQEKLVIQHESIQLIATKELVIECGNVKQTFTAEGGKLREQADQITSMARGTNRIMGGSVKLN